MLQLKNNTPFVAEIALFPDQYGIDTLYLMVKGTFIIGDTWLLAEQPIPLHQGDEYWGEPGKSSLKSANEYHIGKPATDILMYGLACAPELRPVLKMDVGLEVGSIRKVVRVFGDRYWYGQEISKPAPFVNMPLVYERSFGGQDFYNDQVRATELRNPVGRGFPGKKTAAEMEGMPLPNIESPADPIRHWQDIPAPIGFGPIAPNWHPRSEQGGTYDDHWQTNRVPYLPEDFNPSFLNSAPRDQIYPGYLQGGELVRMIGVHPEGDFHFKLPYVALANKAIIRGASTSAPFQLETLALYPNQKQIAMTWRAAIPCPRGFASVQQVTVSLTR